MAKRRPKRGERPSSPLVRPVLGEAMPRFDALFTKNSCLNSTRVLMDVLAAFGVRSRPLSVECVAFNAAFVHLVSRLGRFPTREESFAASDETGAWSVGVDTRPSSTDAAKNAWAGHLVLVVQDEWLLDGSAGQMARPLRGILVPPYVLTEEPVKQATRLYVKLDAGGLLVYTPRPSDTSFLGAAWFQQSAGNRQLVREIVQAVENKTGHKAQRMEATWQEL